MKIGEAQGMYRAYRHQLLDQKSNLIKQRDELTKKANAPGSNKDLYAEQSVFLELSIADVESKFEENQKILDKLGEQYTAVWNAEVAKQQKEALEDYAEDMVKIMEVARRISKGALVPATDEQKLLEYSKELYMAAKNMAMLSKLKDREEYDSLWEDEEEPTEYDPQGTAENTEVGFDLPDIPEMPSGDIAVE